MPSGITTLNYGEGLKFPVRLRGRGAAGFARPQRASHSSRWCSVLAERKTCGTYQWRYTLSLTPSAPSPVPHINACRTALLGSVYSINRLHVAGSSPPSKQAYVTKPPVDANRLYALFDSYREPSVECLHASGIVLIPHSTCTK